MLGTWSQVTEKKRQSWWVRSTQKRWVACGWACECLRSLPHRSTQGHPSHPGVCPICPRPARPHMLKHHKVEQMKVSDLTPTGQLWPQPPTRCAHLTWTAACFSTAPCAVGYACTGRAGCQRAQGPAWLCLPNAEVSSACRLAWLCTWVLRVRLRLVWPARF